MTVLAVAAMTLAVLAGCAGRRGAQPDPIAPPDLSTMVASGVGAAAPASPASTPALPALAPPEPARASGAGAPALRQGVGLYQSGQYRQAEVRLKQALKLGLSSAKDKALAHKHLAFIYCTSQRESQCASAFKAARLADPKFALSPAEAGHPMWAQVYRKALGLK